MHGLGQNRIKRVGVNSIEVLDRVMISLRISRIKVDRIITFVQKAFTECPVCASVKGRGGEQAGRVPSPQSGRAGGPRRDRSVRACPRALCCPVQHFIAT